MMTDTTPNSQTDSSLQKLIQNPVEHLRWSFCENSELLKSIYYFRKKCPSKMLDWVLNMPLGLQLITDRLIESLFIARK